MFLKTLKAERMKLRHSPVWLAFIILPIISAVMGTFNYVQNTEILKDKWYDLWSQHTLFSCYFFIPALIGVYCSYLFRLEHMNHNWNSVMTMPVKISDFYFSKLLSSSFMVVVTQIWIGILFIVSGKLCGINAPIPGQLPLWLLLGTAGGIVICAVQLTLSLVIRSFAVPVGIALMGGIMGLVAAVKGYGLYFPYSLLTIGMSANGSSGSALNILQFLVSSLFYIALCSVLCIIRLKKHDVQA